MAPSIRRAVAALVVAASCTVEGHQFRKESPPFRQELRNEGDIQYTGKINLGNQALEVVPDTGSFEMVMLSDKCSSCGDRKKLYHYKDSSFEEGELEAEQNYGSGSTSSIEAYDDVRIGHLKVDHQMFWEVYDANMPLLQYSSFQGIFGLGPPSSNAKMAKEDALKVKAEVHKMQEAGDDVAQYKPIVKQYEEVAEFSKGVTLWLEHTKMTHFSICLGKAKGSAGYVVYNDDSNEKLFTKTVQVVGDMYWGFKLHGVQVRDLEGSKGKLFLDCNESPCDTILDTGTSLIAAPQDALDKLVKALDKYSSVTGGCSDLTELPDLEFRLGGEDFSLPPEAYVGEMNNDKIDWALKDMPHLQVYKDRHAQMVKEGKPAAKRWCVPLLMSMGSEKMWIMGMPFFRKYYTMFRLSRDSARGQEAKFAEFGQECKLGSQELRSEDAYVRGIPMLVDPSKLLPPKRLPGSQWTVNERLARVAAP